MPNKKSPSEDSELRLRRAAAWKGIGREDPSWTWIDSKLPKRDVVRQRLQIRRQFFVGSDHPRGCGEARHCKRCDPFSEAREHELASLDSGDEKLRTELQEQLRQGVFRDVPRRTCRQLATRLSRLAAFLDRQRLKTQQAFAVLGVSVVESVLDDQDDALSWLNNLQATIATRLDQRAKDAKERAATYRELAGLAGKKSLGEGSVTAVHLAVDRMTKRLGKVYLARAYVALLLVELGLLARNEEPNRERLAKRLAAMLHRADGRAPAARSEQETLAAMVDLAGLRGIANGEDLPPARSPGVSVERKWERRIKKAKSDRGQ